MLTAQTIGDNPRLGIGSMVGRGDRTVERIAAVSESVPGSITFLAPRLDEAALARLRPKLSGTTIICSEKTAGMLGAEDATLLLAEQPRLAFLRVISTYFPPARPAAGVHASAVVSPSARIDATASVGAFCYVGDKCTIGAGAILHPHVTLYEKVSVGKGVIINSGTVIGADGFGYERNEAGELEKFPHIGGVVIEDGVEIGSNTSIDRGTIGNTIIRRNARIDNQIHIAHNVDIGENAAVIAQAMLGGSAKIGANSWVAPAAVVIDQVSVGAGATVGLAAVVTKRVEDGETVMGMPAQPAAEFKAERAAFRKLLAGG
jgi:UDP-3-O-[3-hydroxymyristoyl] glucosamine N-acyltransferase